MGGSMFSIGSETWPGTSKLVEECGEVLQLLGKLIATGGNPAHWDGSNLSARLGEEVADLLAAVTFFAAVNDLNTIEFFARVATKIETFQNWHKQQSPLPTTGGDDGKVT